MSHELRSPLNAILGFAQLMESDTPPPTSTQLESINQILQAGWHLLKLIDEILDLAKVESGQVPLSPEPVSLAEVMLECQGMIEPQAHQLGIKLIFPQIAIPMFVHADRTRFKQVLINLLSNAVKYNSKGGTVEVKCAENKPGMYSDQCKGHWQGIEFRTTGTTIPIIQSSRPGSRWRGRYRYWTCGVQAIGRINGRINWGGKYCRSRECILV